MDKQCDQFRLLSVCRLNYDFDLRVFWNNIADYFVICTVDSLPQLKALRRDVDKEIKTIHSVTPRAIEGTPESLWLIIDYVDVIFHIFHDDLRTTYSLEELWSDASRLELDFLNAE